MFIRVLFIRMATPKFIHLKIIESINTKICYLLITVLDVGDTLMNRKYLV